MTNRLHIHPTHPQGRLISQAVDAITRGAVVVFPTDSGYAIGCHLGDKDAVERIRKIRQLDKHHHFTLLCKDLSSISNYARVDNPTYRLLRAHTPGAYTFILNATKAVPKQLQHPKRKTIGIRVPEYPIVTALVDALGEPLMSVSLHLSEEEPPLQDPEDIIDALDREIDVLVDAGECAVEETTVIDLTTGVPELVRQGSVPML